MTQSRPLPSFGAVLRDIAIHGNPRILTRPSASHEASAEEVPSPKRIDHGLDHQNNHSTGHVRTDVTTLREASAGEVFQKARQEGQQEGYRRGLEEGERQGRELGYEQGLLDGRQAGTKEVQQQTQAARESLDALISRLDQLLGALPAQLSEQISLRVAAAEDDMVALCHTVICRLLGDKALKRDAIVHSVREAISLCCCTSSTHGSISGLLAIHVHPSDLELLQSDTALSAWLKRQEAQKGVNAMPWLADESVRLGGCIVRSTQGSLDARLETQFAALQELLLQARSNNSADPHAVGEEETE